MSGRGDAGFPGGPPAEAARGGAGARARRPGRHGTAGDVAGCGKLYKARSRLYRSQNLEVNMRLKALAEIYTMHSFAPFLESRIENWGKRAWPKQPRKRRKGENERP